MLEPTIFSEERMHYLHAQYLCEKARADCNDKIDTNKRRNIISNLYESK